MSPRAPSSEVGPVLFLIYVNHVAARLKSRYMIFADDLKVYMCLSEPESDSNKFQSDIDVLEATASSWGLSLNQKKCAVMRFQRRHHSPIRPVYHANGGELQWSHAHSDLGVTADDSLKFHEHSRITAGKTGGVAHNFLQSTMCRERDFMIHILVTHIRPIIEYKSMVWNTGYVEDVKRLEAVQRLWTRHIQGLDGKPYEERLKLLDLYSIKERLLRADLIKCWRIFHGLCPINPQDLWEMATVGRTRGNSLKIKVCRCQLDSSKRYFTTRVINAWNLLPDETVTQSPLHKFKSCLATDLGDRLFEHIP